MQNLTRAHRVTVFVALLFVTATANRAFAQRSTNFATPTLPPDHWAVVAARRAALLGFAPIEMGFGDGTLTQAAVGRMLYASTEQSVASSAARSLVAADWQRFAREFPGVAARISGMPTREPLGPPGIPPVTWATSLDTRIVGASGRLLPVRSLDRTRENVAPPTPINNLGDADLEVRLGGTIGNYFAAELASGRGDGSWLLHDWQLAGGVRSLGAWVGKRAPDYGPAVGGGVIFDGRAAFSGGGVMLTNGVQLPWFLQKLGVWRGESFLARIDSSAGTRHPWLFASHVSLTPHRRLTLGATQAFMFSGQGLPPFTFRNFKEMFLTHGIKTAGREFENGIASVEAQWRVPVPHVPTNLYVEWGSDDNHSAWFKFPAVVAGVSVPSLPGAPSVSLGLERASFAAPCSDCNGCACEYYATWYRHYVFMDGWTLDRRPIGHPLGGDGTEWLAYGRFDNSARRLRLETRAFARNRGRYNLFSPTREGRSVGGRIAADYRLTNTFELRADAELEHGRRDWNASSFSAGLRWVP